MIAINTITISSLEYERSFSAINNIITWKRALTPKHISSLLFIQYVGPLINSFVLSNYVKSWMIGNMKKCERNLLSQKNTIKI